LKQLISR